MFLSSLFSRLQASAASRPIDPAIVRWEKILFAVFVATSIVQIWGRWNVQCGYDVGAHLGMLDHLQWSHPIIGLKASFYAYHPPLGFLLARSLYLLGFPHTGSVQLLSLTASLIAFFCLRGTLKSVELLSNPIGVTFLYVVAAIPMQRFLQRCVNLDVLTLATASASLYFSVRIFWSSCSSSQVRRWMGPVLILTLLIGMMVKYSGVLALSIPILASLFSPEKKNIKKSLQSAFLIVLAASALAFPYYYLRYYVPTHSFFPDNSSWLISGWEKSARHWRSDHPFLFLLNFFLGTPFWTHSIVSSLLTEVRLWNVFRNFWTLGFSGNIFFSLRNFPFVYIIPMIVFISTGCVAFLRRATLDAQWRRFAWLICAVSAVYMFGLFMHAFQAPYSGWGPVKGIYVAPALWGMGVFFCEFLLLLHRRLHLSFKGIFKILAALMVLQLLLLF